MSGDRGIGHRAGTPEFACKEIGYRGAVHGAAHALRAAVAHRADSGNGAGVKLGHRFGARFGGNGVKHPGKRGKGGGIPRHSAVVHPCRRAFGRGRKAAYPLPDKDKHGVGGDKHRTGNSRFGRPRKIKVSADRKHERKHERRGLQLAFQHTVHHTRHAQSARCSPAGGNAAKHAAGTAVCEPAPPRRDKGEHPRRQDRRRNAVHRHAAERGGKGKGIGKQRKLVPGGVQLPLLIEIPAEGIDKNRVGCRRRDQREHRRGAPVGGDGDICRTESGNAERGKDARQPVHAAAPLIAPIKHRKGKHRRKNGKRDTFVQKRGGKHPAENISAPFARHRAHKRKSERRHAGRKPGNSQHRARRRKGNIPCARKCHAFYPCSVHFFVRSFFLLPGNAIIAETGQTLLSKRA